MMPASSGWEGKMGELSPEITCFGLEVTRASPTRISSVIANIKEEESIVYCDQGTEKDQISVTINNIDQMGIEKIVKKALHPH